MKRSVVSIHTDVAWPSERGDVQALSSYVVEAAGPYAGVGIKVATGTATYEVLGQPIRDDGQPTKQWIPIIGMSVDASVNGGYTFERFAPGESMNGRNYIRFLMIRRISGTPTGEEAHITTGLYF